MVPDVGHIVNYRSLPMIRFLRLVMRGLPTAAAYFRVAIQASLTVVLAVLVIVLLMTVSCLLGALLGILLDLLLSSVA